MYLKEVGINSRNWIDSAQDGDYWRVLMNMALSLWFPYSMELVWKGKLKKNCHIEVHLIYAFVHFE